MDSKQQYDLPQDLIARLSAYDTPTICNALEIVGGSRSNRGFTRGTFVVAYPTMKPILGFARTATLKTAHPYTEPASVIKQRRIAWYEHVEARGAPTIAVVQDVDDPAGLGAFWGEVHSNVLKGLGVKGVVTNGAIRDFGMLAQDFQILAGCVSPSHGFAQITSMGDPVCIYGLTICDGDLLHADVHGAIVIPAAALSELPHAIDVMVRKERPLIEASRREGFSVGDLKTAMQEADDIH